MQILDQSKRYHCDPNMISTTDMSKTGEAQPLAAAAPRNEYTALNEPRLPKQYDRDLNDVNGVHIFGKGCLDAPGYVPPMFKNDEHTRADADGWERSHNKATSEPTVKLLASKASDEPSILAPFF